MLCCELLHLVVLFVYHVPVVRKTLSDYESLLVSFLVCSFTHKRLVFWSACTPSRLGYSRHVTRSLPKRSYLLWFHWHFIHNSVFKAQLCSAKSHPDSFSPNTAFITLSSKPSSVELSHTQTLSVPALHS